LSRKVFVHTTELDRDGYPQDCPFNTRRAGRTRDLARSLGLLEGLDRAVVEPRALPDDLLERFHTKEYLQALRDAGHGGIDPDRALVAGLGTAECPIFPGMFEYVSLAAGGTVTGARLVLDGNRVAFNPSGGFHHAHPDHAAGFCFLNDVVLAAEVLVDAGKRVAIVDIDAHHGDAVQDAFYRRPEVLTISMHEDGRTLFPGTGFVEEIGEGTGRGYNVNLPLPSGTTDGCYLRAFREVVPPLLGAFSPDVLMLEIGMDTLVGDPLTHMRLTNGAPAEVVETLLAFGKPLLVTGGGGYHLEHTVRGWTLCWGVLCGDHSRFDDLSIGMGGVLLQNADWLGGLRDRAPVPDAESDASLRAEVEGTVKRLREAVFPIHGI
jgi:acetoin utilization protein AcuC